MDGQAAAPERFAHFPSHFANLVALNFSSAHADPAQAGSALRCLRRRVETWNAKCPGARLGLLGNALAM